MQSANTISNTVPPPVQPVTAILRVHWATSVTQLQASAIAGKEPLVVSAQTANQGSGVSPAAAPVSVTVTQIFVTLALGSVETAGTTQQDISVNGKHHSLSDFAQLWPWLSDLW